MDDKRSSILAEAAQRRKRTLVMTLGAGCIGTLSLFSFGLMQSRHDKRQAALQRFCDLQPADAPPPSECQALNQRSSRTGYAYGSRGGMMSGVVSHSSPARYGGFGSTGAAHGAGG